jgi:hypothetical protein
MPETGSEEGLLVRAEPLTLAQSVCEELVDEVRIMDGALCCSLRTPHGHGRSTSC